MKKLLTTLTMLSLIVITPATVLAEDVTATQTEIACVVTSIEQAIDQSDLVALGEVKSSKRNDTGILFEIDLETIWKGQEQRTISVYNPDNAPLNESLTNTLAVGVKYVLLLDKSSEIDAYILVSPCMRPIRQGATKIIYPDTEEILLKEALGQPQSALESGQPLSEGDSAVTTELTDVCLAKNISTAIEDQDFFVELQLTEELANFQVEDSTLILRHFKATVANTWNGTAPESIDLLVSPLYLDYSFQMDTSYILQLQNTSEGYYLNQCSDVFTSEDEVLLGTTLTFEEIIDALNIHNNNPVKPANKPLNLDNLSTGAFELSNESVIIGSTIIGILALIAITYYFKRRSTNITDRSNKSGGQKVNPKKK